MLKKTFIILIIALFIALFATLILLDSENNINFAYIDLEGQLGLAHLCRKDKCENLKNQVIPVKDYISTKDK